MVIDLDGVTVVSKLHREAASASAYGQLSMYEFEIRGEDEDAIYHHYPDMDTAPVQEAVLKSGKKDSPIKLRMPKSLSLICFVLLVQFPSQITHGVPEPVRECTDTPIQRLTVSTREDCRILCIRGPPLCFFAVQILSPVHVIIPYLCQPPQRMTATEAAMGLCP